MCSFDLVTGKVEEKVTGKVEENRNGKKTTIFYKRFPLALLSNAIIFYPCRALDPDA